MTADLTVIVLTYNEARHIARCLDSVRGLVRRVVVVDSHSSDETVEIARRHGADVVQNPWISPAVQFNWALDNVKIDTQWIMRLDADEVVLGDLASALCAMLPTQIDAVAGLTVNRRIHFLGRWICHGGVYPIRTLRIWRAGRGRCEDRWMDEHVIVDGEIAHVDADIADINLNDVTWWTQKHNGYATREAIDLLRVRYGLGAQDIPNGLSAGAKIKRHLKVGVYSRLPLGLRAVLYFLYRYVLRFGFLDGWAGFAFHSLQAGWYRLLVDVKVHELESRMQQEGLSLDDIISREVSLPREADRPGRSSST